MIGQMGWWRHAIVGASVAGCSVLGFTGLVGGGVHPERFDAKQVVVQPSGADGLRIREVVDQDFGSHKRHGYERVIPLDFGTPDSIDAASPDANVDIDLGFDPEYPGPNLRIRLGDPNTTYTGQHRYELSYTYPRALVGTGRLALDIIGDRERLETGRFDVVVTGFELADTTCNRGPAGTVGGCELVADGENYRVVVEPLRPGEAITIGGTIVGRRDPVVPAVPAIPERRPDRRGLVGLLMLPLGAISSAGVYLASRRRGRNEVFAGGAADAAFGALPPPASGAQPPMTSLVPDDKMHELTTIEFVPPKGVEPWQAAAVLGETVDDSTVSAWFSGLIAHDVLAIERKDKRTAILSLGPKHDAVDQDTAGILGALFAGRDTVEIGQFDAAFSTAWQRVKQYQSTFVANSGWWKRLPPASTSAGPGAWIIVVVIGMVVFGAGSVLSAALGAFHLLPLALLFGLIVPAVMAYSSYRVLRPARSATGSAVALRSESFRTFLEASEGQHVEWAWKQGLLREYSAWAVALGAADAWERALAASQVPPSAGGLTTPLIFYNMGPSITSTRTAPSQSGSGGGGGGGFSGGFSGGGGGGGSSGSW